MVWNEPQPRAIADDPIDLLSVQVTCQVSGRGSTPIAVCIVSCGLLEEVGEAIIRSEDGVCPCLSQFRPLPPRDGHVPEDRKRMYPVVQPFLSLGL